LLVVLKNTLTMHGPMNVKLYSTLQPFSHMTLGMANINASFQDTGLPWCFAGWQVRTLQTHQQAKQQHCV